MFEEHDLVKIVLVAILVTFVLSWIIPYGYFSGSEFTTSGLNRLGLVDISLSGVYSANFFLQQLLFVAFVGIFYGIISKISGYKALVSSVAKKFERKEKLFVVLSSFVVALLTSFLSQSFVVLLFVPFIINVASKLKLDKITAFLITFGSMLVGTIGATYGTEGLVYFITYLNYYATVDVTTLLGIRFGILVLTFIVYNAFLIKHVKKVLSSKKNEDKIVDLFEVEDTKDSKKKVKVWPMAVCFIALFVFAILGFVDWSTDFGVTAFDTFHTWLTELAVGDYTIISYIIGSNATAFGSWDLYSISLIASIVLVLAMIFYKVKFNDVIDNALEGLKNVVKPMVLLLLIYVIFVLVYWSPFTNTISNWILTLADGFNPFLATIASAVASIFHIDFGYTGYVMGDFMSSYFGDSFNASFIVYVATNGLIQVIAPTSILLMLGLSYLDIPYKKWIKYIWKFFLVMLVLLLVIFALLAYL
jgi:uncharacterized ion transporter superfamily protein YfcC